MKEKGKYNLEKGKKSTVGKSIKKERTEEIKMNETNSSNERNKGGV